MVVLPTPDMHRALPTLLIIRVLAPGLSFFESGRRYRLLEPEPQQDDVGQATT